MTKLEQVALKEKHEIEFYLESVEVDQFKADIEELKKAYVDTNTLDQAITYLQSMKK